VDPVAATEWLERARALSEEGWWLADLCGLDRLSLGDGARFHVVVQLLDRAGNRRMSLHVEAEGDPPSVPSVTSIWPSANFMEREVFDLFGVRFEGHPNPKRLFMPDEWEGHPLRKDYGVGKVPVEFIPQPFLQIDAPGQSPVPTESGRDVDGLGQGGPPRRRAVDSGSDAAGAEAPA
jgi:NADH-quinone oxidoreductase subunit C